MLLTFLFSLLLLTLSADAQEVQVFQFRDFSGGIISDYDLLDMENKYGANCVNFEINKGGLELRQGYKKYMALPTGYTGMVPLRIYSYNISEPDYYVALTYYPDSTLSRFGDNGEITVAVCLDTIISGSAKNNVLRVFMNPYYNQPGDYYGWKTGWSSDLFSYTQPTATRYYGSILGEGIVIGNVLRIPTGSVKMDEGIYGYGNYTYPLWMGYIGKSYWHIISGGSYHFTYRFHCLQSVLSPLSSDLIWDGAGSPNRPDSLGAIASNQVKFNGDSLEAGVGVAAGRYFVKLVAEYDGYQYAIPTERYNWYIDNSSSGGNVLRIGLFYPDLMTLNPRLSAICVFTSDPIGALEAYYAGSSSTKKLETPGEFLQEMYHPTVSFRLIGSEGVDYHTIPYYFRKRVVVAASIDKDTTEQKAILGYGWKENAVNGNGARLNWIAATDTAQTPDQTGHYISVFLDADDFDATMPDMYTYIGHNSTENMVAPEYLAYIGGRMWAGSVLVDSPGSTINKLYRNMIILSPYGQPDSYPINNFILVGGSGSYITGLKEWQGNALVFTNDALEVWSTDNPPIRLERFVGMGCIAPRSIQVTTEGVFYANSGGIFLYTGDGIPQLITALVDEAYNDMFGIDPVTNKSTLPYAISTYSRKDQQYIFIDDKTVQGRDITIPGGSYATWYGLPPPKYYGGQYAFVYNLQWKAWTKWEWKFPFRDALANYEGDMLGMMPDSVYICKIKSAVDSAVYYDAFPYQYGATSGTRRNTYQAYWRSGMRDFGLPYQEKEFDKVQMDYQYNSSADTLLFGINTDGGGWGQTVFISTTYIDSTLSGDRRTIESQTIGGGTVLFPSHGLPVLGNIGLWTPNPVGVPDDQKAGAYIKINGFSVSVIPRGVK